MMELDKKIREGLARQAAAPMASHPDPDLLTAFVEQALSQPERQQVLQHLSLCTGCREVVALSLPELDAAPLVAAQLQTSIWRRWLVVRWAAAAAAVMVVAGAVTLYKTNQPRQIAIVDGKDYIASQEAKARQAQTPVQAPKTEAHATQEPAIPSATSVANDKKPSEEINPAEPVMMANAGLADRLASTSKDAAGAKKEKTVIPPSRSDEPMVAKAAPAQVAPPPVSAAIASRMPTVSTPADVATLNRPVQVQGGALAGAGASANSAFPTGDGHALRPSGDQPVQTYDQGGATITLAETEPRSGIIFGRRGMEAKTLEGRRPLGVGMFSTAPAPIPNAPMLAHGWSVTTDGLLKRSHGVNDSHTVRVADGVFFKAVAETGTEVWAGGVGGALYHSMDDGRNWMKVMPSAGDQPLIADITVIHATQRGTAELGTSSGERWITIDGGQHWTRHQ